MQEQVVDLDPLSSALTRQEINHQRLASSSKEGKPKFDQLICIIFPFCKPQQLL
jgi:hypothetical protein